MIRRILSAVRSTTAEFRPIFFSETAYYRAQYANLREAAYETMLLQFASFTEGVTDISPINGKTLSAWERQWLPVMPPNEQWSHWDWRREAGNWRKHIDRFEVAIWSNHQLCGLAVGKPSKRRNNLSIYLLQGSPVDGHPLKGKVLPLILDVAEAYGTALNCRELRLVKPLGGIVGKYQRLGFRVEKSRNVATYCVRSI